MKSTNCAYYGKNLRVIQIFRSLQNQCVYYVCANIYGLYDVKSAKNGGNLQFLINIRLPLNELIVRFYWRANILIVFIIRARLYDNWGKYFNEWYNDKKTEISIHITSFIRCWVIFLLVYTLRYMLLMRLYFAFILCVTFCVYTRFDCENPWLLFFSMLHHHYIQIQDQYTHRKMLAKNECLWTPTEILLIHLESK